MTPTPEAYWITKPAQVRALTSSVRQEIVDALESAGPCTMTRLGALLGRKPDGLYFHIRRLLKVGLLVECAKQREGRHVAAVFDLLGRPTRLSYAPPIAPKDLAAVVAAALRTGSREFALAVREHFRDRPDANAPPPDLWGARVKGWLTAPEAAEVNRLLAQAASILRRGAPRPQTRCISLSLALTPAGPAKPEGDPA